MSGKNWLERYRQRAGYTQEALASALGKDVRYLRKWELCQIITSVPFTELSAILEVSPDELQEAHRVGQIIALLEKGSSPQVRELIAQFTYLHLSDGMRNRLIDFQEENLETLSAELWRAFTACRNDVAKLPPKINRLLIADALEQADTTGLTKRILKRMGSADVADAAGQLAGWIESGDFARIRDACNQAITESVNAQQERSALERLREFIFSVALTATYQDRQIRNGCRMFLKSNGRLWAIRLWIDASLGMSRMTQVELDRTKTGGFSNMRLDDGAARGVEAPLFWGEPDEAVWHRVHAIISNLAETLAYEDECPLLDADPAGEQSAFRGFCSDLNRRIKETNVEDLHVFAYSSCYESDAVKDRLQSLLQDLRFFICTRNDHHLSPLRVDAKELESWIANNLHKIETKLRGSFQPSMEENPMSTKNVTNIHHHYAPNEGQQTFGDESPINVQNNGADLSELLEIMRQILRQSDMDNPSHREGRAAAHKILAAGEQGKLLSSGKRWLESASKALDSGDKLANLINNALEIFSKLGIGS